MQYPSTKFHSSKGHTQLSDEITLQALGEKKENAPFYTAEAYTANDLNSRRFDSMTDVETASPVPEAKIKKTVQLDQY